MKKIALVLFVITASIFSHAEVIDRVLAVVNSEPILASDVRKLQTQIKNNQTFDESLGLDIETVRHDPKAQLEYLVLQKIIDSEIKRLNLAVTSDRVEQEIRDLARRNHITTNEVYAAVKNEGLSVAEYQAFIKNQVERKSLFDQEIISKLKVSEEEVRTEYNKKFKDAQNSIFEFTLSHIFFNPKKGGDAQALKRAEAALDKIHQGLDFDAAAEQFSEDPNFTNGGFLGVFKSGESVKEIDAAASKLNTGDISGVVKTKMGYHILKVINKKVINDPQFEKQREAIRSQILEKHFQQQLKLWLQNKKDEAFIRYNVQ